MPTRSTTVRFDDDLWELVAQESAAAGVSTAQFVRDAAILRLGYLAERRGSQRARTTLGSIAANSRDRRVAVHPSVLDERRIKALRRTGLLDSDPDPTFDRLTRIASRALDAPVALVSLVDRNRQFFKSCIGLPEPWASERETPLSHSFCQHVVISRKPLAIRDAREHPELRDNLAIPDLGVVAYLGVPLVTASGEALGSICVIDSKPRDWTPDQIALVGELAEAVIETVERR